MQEMPAAASWYLTWSTCGIQELGPLAGGCVYGEKIMECVCELKEDREDPRDRRTGGKCSDDGGGEEQGKAYTQRNVYQEATWDIR